MIIELTEDLWNEIQEHYSKSMTVETFVLGSINAWAFNANGNEDPEIEKDKRIFEFCMPDNKPIYAYINEDINKKRFLDTTNYMIVEME